MEAVQKDYWYFVVLLIFLLFRKDTLQLKAKESTVRLEEGMTLDCLCPWSGNLSMVSWTKSPNRVTIAVYHPDYGVHFAPAYDGRVRFLKASPMDGSISIANVTEQDIGLYRCSLQTFPQGSWAKDTLVEHIVSVVTIQPDSEVIAEVSDNLTIHCDHTHNSTVYRVTIERLAEGRRSVIAVCRVTGEDEGLVERDYTNRARVNCSDAMGVSLHLTDIVKEDKGLYQCRFSTDDGVQTTTVLLTTVTAQEIPSSPQALALYVGGGVSGLLLIVMVVLALKCLHRRRRRREEYRVKLHPASRRPHNTYAQGGVYDRMRKGGRRQGKASPVYANIAGTRPNKKRKR